jgi:predicted transcriptional regulator
VKALHDLTDQQLAILAVVWTRGEPTANEIHQALEPTAGLARGTIGTMLHRLERQGILRHRAEGREFRYHAAISREEVMAARLRGLVGGLFGGDLAAMVSFAVSAPDARKGDVEKLRQLLDDHAARKGRR